MTKISKRTVDAAKPGTQEYFIWDDALPGLGLRVYPSGRKTYLIQYRHHGRTKRLTLGQHGKITPDKARRTATKRFGELADGKDPRRHATGSSDPLVKDLCELYLLEGCGLKKPSTLATDKGRIERHIKPLLGDHRAGSITRSDIGRFLQDVAAGRTALDEKTGSRGRSIVTGGQGTATRTLGLLGAIFTFAKEQGYVDANPVHGVKRFPDKKRERFLTMDEFHRLGQALDRAEAAGKNAYALAAIKLLILTGCRRSEVLNLEWDFIDWDNGYLRLPDSKSGPKVVVLSKEAIAELKRIRRRQGCNYVFPGTDDLPFAGLQKIWDWVRTKAKLRDLRLHDLRHSYASTAISAGVSIAYVGRLLGHKDLKTTDRYVHLAEQSMRDTSNVISNEIAAAMNGRKQMTE